MLPKVLLKFTIMIENQHFTYKLCPSFEENKNLPSKEGVIM